jgi:hypothetical protein
MIGSLELVTWRGSRRLSCKFAIQSRVSKYPFPLRGGFIHGVRVVLWCNNLVLLDCMYCSN